MAGLGDQMAERRGIAGQETEKLASWMGEFMWTGAQPTILPHARKMHDLVDRIEQRFARFSGPSLDIYRPT